MLPAWATRTEDVFAHFVWLCEEHRESHLNADMVHSGLRTSGKRDGVLLKSACNVNLPGKGTTRGTCNAESSVPYQVAKPEPLP